MAGAYDKLPDNKYIKEYKRIVLDSRDTTGKKGYITAINIIFMWLLWEKFRYSTKDSFIQLALGLTDKNTKMYSGGKISRFIEGKFKVTTNKSKNGEKSVETAEKIEKHTGISKECFIGDKHLLEEKSDLEIILFTLIYEKQHLTGFHDLWRNKFLYSDKECRKKEPGSDFAADPDRLALYNEVEAQNYKEKYSKLNPFRIPRNDRTSVMYYIKYGEKISNRWELIYKGLLDVDESAEQLNDYLLKTKTKTGKEDFNKLLEKLESNLERELIVIKYFRTIL